MAKLGPRPAVRDPDLVGPVGIELAFERMRVRGFRRPPRRDSRQRSKLDGRGAWVPSRYGGFALQLPQQPSPTWPRNSRRGRPEDKIARPPSHRRVSRVGMMLPSSGPRPHMGSNTSWLSANQCGSWLPSARWLLLTPSPSVYGCSSIHTLGLRVGPLDVRLQVITTDAPGAASADLDPAQFSTTDQRIHLGGADVQLLRYLRTREKAVGHADTLGRAAHGMRRCPRAGAPIGRRVLRTSRAASTCSR